MFDANMSWLKKGRFFFAKVHSCDKDGNWYKKGIRQGQILLCHMLQDKAYSPLVDVMVNGKRITIAEDYKFYGWMVYEGRTDGRGFINSESKALAKAILETDEAEEFIGGRDTSVDLGNF